MERAFFAELESVKIVQQTNCETAQNQMMKCWCKHATEHFAAASTLNMIALQVRDMVCMVV